MEMVTVTKERHGEGIEVQLYATAVHPVATQGGKHCFATRHTKSLCMVLKPYRAYIVLADASCTSTHVYTKAKKTRTKARGVAFSGGGTPVAKLAWQGSMSKKEIELSFCFLEHIRLTTDERMQWNAQAHECKRSQYLV